jgi:hypothetical protein
MSALRNRRRGYFFHLIWINITNKKVAALKQICLVCLRVYDHDAGKNKVAFDWFQFINYNLSKNVVTSAKFNECKGFSL